MRQHEPEWKLLQGRNTEAHRSLRKAAHQLLSHVEINAAGEQVVPDYYLTNLQKRVDKAKETIQAIFQYVEKQKQEEAEEDEQDDLYESIPR